MKELIAAIAQGDVQRVKGILAEEHNAANQTQTFKHDGKSLVVRPLAFAASLGHTTIVRILLKCENIEVNKLMNKKPALFYAVLGGHLKIVSLLLEHPAIDINFKLPGGELETTVFDALVECELLNSGCEFEQYTKSIAMNTAKRPTMNLLNRFKSADLSVILAAVDMDNLALLDLILKHKDVKVNVQKDDQGITPLSCAVANGNIEILRRLLEHKDIDVNFVDKMMGSTALMHAVIRDQIEMIKLLLRRKSIDVNKGIHTMTPLHYAVEHGQLDCVQLLLSNENINVNCITTALLQREITTAIAPLHQAAIKGFVDITRCLLRHKNINVNLEGPSGATPLAIITSNISGKENVMIKIMKMLLQRNDIDINRGTAAPLYQAARGGYVEATILLLKHKCIDVNILFEGSTPLHGAIFDGFSDVVRCLLRHKNIDVNVENRDGLTPLALAIRSECMKLDIIKMLIERSDIDLNRGSYSKTPLYLAADAGNVELIQLLLKQCSCVVVNWDAEVPGEDVQYDQADYATSLHEAAILDTPRTINKMIELLNNMQNADDVNSYNTAGATPLYLAAERGHTDIVALLLSCKDINVNAPTSRIGDSFKLTALTAAFKEGHMDVVELLLRSPGIDVNSFSVLGDTPLIGAINRGDQHLVRLLLDNPQLDITVKNAEGLTALHVAKMSAQQEILTMIEAHVVKVKKRKKKQRKKEEAVLLRANIEAVDTLD